MGIYYIGSVHTFIEWIKVRIRVKMKRYQINLSLQFVPFAYSSALNTLLALLLDLGFGFSYKFVKEHRFLMFVLLSGVDIKKAYTRTKYWYRTDGNAPNLIIASSYFFSLPFFRFLLHTKNKLYPTGQMLLCMLASWS